MRVIVATDGSTHSHAAVEFVSSMGLKKGDTVLILTIVDLALPAALGVDTGVSLQTLDVEERFRTQAESTLAAAKTRLMELLADEHIAVSTELSFGSPQRRIVEMAEKNATDLIIVGSHVHSTWERLLVGSVSDAVVHHAPCAVLVVRN